VNKLVAGPLPAEDQISAITPPLFVNGATAKKPDKKRVTRRVWMFGARACPRWKRVYRVSANVKTGLRPVTSEPGPQNNGWMGGSVK